MGVARFESRQAKVIFLFSQPSKLVLGPTQPPTEHKNIFFFFCLVTPAGACGRPLTLCLVSQLRMTKAIYLLTKTPSQSARWQLQTFLSLLSIRLHLLLLRNLLLTLSNVLFLSVQISFHFVTSYNNSSSTSLFSTVASFNFARQRLRNTPFFKWIT
jgi:hypothetical protein